MEHVAGIRFASTFEAPCRDFTNDFLHLTRCKQFAVHRFYIADAPPYPVDVFGHFRFESAVSSKDNHRVDCVTRDTEDAFERLGMFVVLMKRVLKLLGVFKNLLSPSPLLC